MSEKQQFNPSDYNLCDLTEEQQDLYKYCFEEDGYAFQLEEEEIKKPGQNDPLAVEEVDYDDEDYYYDDYDEEGEELDDQIPYYNDFSDDGDDNDYLHDFQYEDKFFGGSGKSHHFSTKSQSNSEKVKKSGRSSKGSSGTTTSLNTTIPLRRQFSSKSEDNLRLHDRKKRDSNDNRGQRHKVLEMLEASKQTTYWSVFDTSYQGVLEYGVVIKLIGGNQYLIFCAGQNVNAVTLRGFHKHYKKIEEGDVVVYQVIDSTFSFNVTKVYISANSELEEIEILYRRGELSPTLYQLHKRIKEQSMKVLTSQKGNSLQEFLYQCQERSFATRPTPFHHHQQLHVTDETKQSSATVQPVAKELKELYHFNQMILEKIIDYFLDYLQKQPQMKSMIRKMMTTTIRTSSSMNSLPTTTGDSPKASSVPALSHDDGANSGNNGSSLSITSATTKPTRKLEKSKSKVGILLYLFFLESIHHILYQLPSQNHTSLPSRRPMAAGRSTRTAERRQIHEIYHYSISSYNMNNCFGKLIRCLFQQIFLYLCENNVLYSPSAFPSPVKSRHHHPSSSDLMSSEENSPVFPSMMNDDRPKGPVRSYSQELYHRMIERICHMDVITHILPFLRFEDIYQCLFLLFPQSLSHHLYQHTRPATTSVDLGSSPDARNIDAMLQRANQSTSIFGNLENLKIIIQHLFHEINQNTYYIGIANDIYDLFSCNIDWEKIMNKMI